MYPYSPPTFGKEGVGIFQNGLNGNDYRKVSKMGGVPKTGGCNNKKGGLGSFWGKTISKTNYFIEHK